MCASEPTPHPGGRMRTLCDWSSLLISLQAFCVFPRRNIGPLNETEPQTRSGPPLWNVTTPEPENNQGDFSMPPWPEIHCEYWLQPWPFQIAHFWLLKFTASEPPSSPCHPPPTSLYHLNTQFVLPRTKKWMSSLSVFFFWRGGGVCVTMWCT